MYKTRKEQPTWEDIVRERHEREDAPVRRLYEQYRKFGRGHLSTNVPVFEKRSWK